MRGKILLLMIVGVTFLSVPGHAAAGEWKLHPASSFVTNIFGTSLRTEAGDTVNCGSSTGGGETTSESTGTIAFLFQSCTAGGFACTTEGKTSGTVTLQAEFTLVYLLNKLRGIKLTGIGPSKTIAEFKCLAGLVPVVVTGDLIGEVTSPACNESSKSLSFTFTAAKHGVQSQMQITGTGTKYDLTATKSGTPSTASLTMGGTMVFSKTVTVTCP